MVDVTADTLKARAAEPGAAYNKPLPMRCRGGRCDPHKAGLNRILYLGADPKRCDDFIAALGRAGEPDLASACPRPQIYIAGKRVCWIGEHDPAQAAARLGEVYFNLLVLDCRWYPGDGGSFAEQSARALRLLDQLDSADDVELRYGFHRILVLLCGPEQDEVDQLIAELGYRGIRAFVRDRGPCVEAPSEEQQTQLARRTLARAVDMIQHRDPPQTALCLSGGGITGLNFEVGALKCLDDCLGPGASNRLDMFFGISAGAVVGGLLAVGYGVEEIMTAIAGVEGGRIPRLDLSVLRLQHLNHGDVAERVRRAARSAGRRLVKRTRRKAGDDSVFEYGDLIPAPFRATAFEALLREVLMHPGTTNDFRELLKPLYVGVSDQDRRQHVLLGSEGWGHVPISRAIAASLAFNPAFASVTIEGRFYEDGAVTRTSNFTEALRRGANLIFVIDPFVPYVADDPGYAAQRGAIFNVDQNLRTISYTRFEAARNTVLRRHPEASCYTFLPSNRMRRLMSINPMDHRPYLEIWRGAYLSTLKRLMLLRYRLSGDLSTRGFEFDTARAEEIAARLSQNEHPTLEDFFLDGVVAPHRPPLAGKGLAGSVGSAGSS